LRHDKPLYRLLLLTLSHLIVDGYANVIGPLMIVFAWHGVFSEDNAKLLPAITAAAGSLTQPLAGILADRGVPRGALLAGPAFAAGGIAMAMLSEQAALVVVFLVVSGVGIAIFHPEAAVLASIGAGQRASRWMSIFLFGGTMGLWLGPVLCGYLLKVTTMANTALILATPGLLFGLYLSRSWIATIHPEAMQPDQPVTGSSPARDSNTAAQASALRPQSSPTEVTTPAAAAAPEARACMPDPPQPWRNAPLISLTLQATLRALAMGTVAVVVPWWGREHGAAIDVIGNLSGLFLFSGGVGMLLVGLLCTPRWEVPLLVITAIAGAIHIALLGWADTFWQASLCIAAGGVLLNGLNAVIVSMAQRTSPQGTRTASALTMGFAWGLGGVAGPLLVWLVQDNTTALCVSAAALLPAAILPLMMSRLPEVPHAPGDIPAALPVQTGKS